MTGLIRKDDFTASAAEVADALKALRECEFNVKQAREDLAECERERDECQTAFTNARDAFHEQFPEMAPALGVVADPVQPAAPQRPATPEPVMSPQGPLAFRDLDDDFSPEGMG